MIVSRLAKALSDKGMNQKQLAEAAGLTEAAICRYLQGSRTAREDALIKLSRTLGVSIDWLLGNESTMGQVKPTETINNEAKMRNIKCADCAEYKDEWCKKIIDSPYPDIVRDCQYFHEVDKDIVKVVRCKDCKHWTGIIDKPRHGACDQWCTLNVTKSDDFCSRGERKEE